MPTIDFTLRIEGTCVTISSTTARSHVTAFLTGQMPASRQRGS